MDGILALDLVGCGDRSVTFFEERTHPHIKLRETSCARSPEHKIPTLSVKRRSNLEVDELSNLDHVATNASSSQFEAQLYISEDNEAVIKMIIKGQKSYVTCVQYPQSCV